MTADKIAIGLVGAGPWARFVHAPMFASHPRTRLAGIWARRPEAAAELASSCGAPSFTSFEELLANCDAVSFSVPPDVQASMAITAARAGKALLLEKPLALDLEQAERLAAEVDRAGVPTMVNLTWRYTTAVGTFLDAVALVEPIGGRGHFISGALLGGPFATPWRLEKGPLFDLGPHVIDLLDAALGPVVRARAHGDARRWVGLLLEHRSGVVSEASLSAHSGIDPFRAGVEVYAQSGALDIDCAAAVTPEGVFSVAGELADIVASGRSHALDVHRGVHIQRVLEQAAAASMR